ncbi:MAG TPA: dihydroneopterin aldolase [Polyangiaceae bacterium]
MARDRIQLSKMVFPCELGIFAWERRRTQALEVELEMFLDLEQASRGDLALSVDYSVIYEQVRFLARHGRWRLIESLAFALARHLLSPPSPSELRRSIDAVSIGLTKPEALQGRAIPHVRIERSRSWCALHERRPEPGSWTLDCLVATDEAGAYHLDLAPGASFDIPKGARGHVVAGSVECDGRVLGPRDEFEPGNRCALNHGSAEARVLLLAALPL